MKELVFLTSIITALGQNGGKGSCPCLTEHKLKNKANFFAQIDGKDCIVYQNPATKKRECLPLDYGLGCKAWDKTITTCTDDSPPSWCDDQFCFVDETCEGMERELVGGAIKGGLGSGFFPDQAPMLRYSYETCGAPSSFAKDYRGVKMSESELRSTISSELQTLRGKAEELMKEISLGGPDYTDCSFLDSCECKNKGICTWGKGQWSTGEGTQLNFNQATITNFRKPVSNDIMCLAQNINPHFHKIKSQWYSDQERIGYMYMGVQQDGSMIQWPATEWYKLLH